MSEEQTLISKLNARTATGKPYYSFEFFPPKTEAGVVNLYSRIQRMSLLEPTFIDFTWGAGGSTEDLTLELSANSHSYFGVDVMMHVSCTDMTRDKLRVTLSAAKAQGIRNILALRGDPVRGADAWAAVEDGFEYAWQLVAFIREEFGEYFGICVAGYPEGHVDAVDAATDLQYLKAKVDAGADFIITQVFYDTSLFLEFMRQARAVGISCPIIPGIMPIQNYTAFRRMTSFCKTHVPNHIWKSLKPIRHDDEKVKQYGVQLGVSMCKELLAAGSPGLHFYTLNLERSARLIMEELGLIQRLETRKFPWRASQVSRRQNEDVRPIFWANRPKSYLHRTYSWDEFPNGRWGDGSSPAFGSLGDYHLSNVTTDKADERRAFWGKSLSSIQDVCEVFARYIEGSLAKLPWCSTPLQLESLSISESLVRLNRLGFLTINSQPRVNGKESTDVAVGWGASGGYVYQKAYLEFFTSAENLAKIFHLIHDLKEFPWMTYQAVDSKGRHFTNSRTTDPIAVTWGVFPDSEIKQPTVVDLDTFLVWKDEAFQLWLTDWASIYDKGSHSAAVIQRVYNSYYLVNIVDNDYVNGDIFRFLDRLMEIPDMEHDKLKPQ